MWKFRNSFGLKMKNKINDGSGSEFRESIEEIGEFVMILILVAARAAKSFLK